MTCAFAVRGAFLKLKGVKQVDVSLNKGTASATLRDGNTLTPEDFWQTVRKNGYTAKATKIVARGTIDQVDGRTQFRFAGRSYRLEKVEATKGSAVIQGTLHPGKDLEAGAIEVQSIRP